MFFASPSEIYGSDFSACINPMGFFVRASTDRGREKTMWGEVGLRKISYYIRFGWPLQHASPGLVVKNFFWCCLAWSVCWVVLQWSIKWRKLWMWEEAAASYHQRAPSATQLRYRAPGLLQPAPGWEGMSNSSFHVLGARALCLALLLCLFFSALCCAALYWTQKSCVVLVVLAGRNENFFPAGAACTVLAGKNENFFSALQRRQEPAAAI